jgi:hypothetical protein
MVPCFVNSCSVSERRVIITSPLGLGAAWRFHGETAAFRLPDLDAPVSRKLTGARVSGTVVSSTPARAARAWLRDGSLDEEDWILAGEAGRSAQHGRRG